MRNFEKTIQEMELEEFASIMSLANTCWDCPIREFCKLHYEKESRNCYKVWKLWLESNE